MKYSKNAIVTFDCSSCYTLQSGIIWITGISGKDLIFRGGDKIDFRALQGRQKRRIIGQVMEDCELHTLEEQIYENTEPTYKVREIGTAPVQG